MFNEIFKSSSAMLSFWSGCIVMGLIYLFGLWDGQGSPAFIVGQVVIGAVGLLREIHLDRKTRTP